MRDFLFQVPVDRCEVPGVRMPDLFRFAAQQRISMLSQINTVVQPLKLPLILLCASMCLWLYV